MNAEKKWTPGPYHREGTLVFALDERNNVNRFSALCQGGFMHHTRHERVRTPDEEVEATAVLFAAAPDMAEALTPLADLAAAYFRDGRRDDVPDSTAVWGFNDVTLTAGDLRKAVAALRKAGAL